MMIALNRHYLLIFVHILALCLQRLPVFSLESFNLRDSTHRDLQSKETFTWRDLTTRELQQWYTAADLCVLNVSDKISFPQDIRAKNCVNITRGNRRMFCGVGMGNNNYPCYGPYGDARHSFKRGVVGYTNASSKPLFNVIYNLFNRSSVLVFLGDSTMRQKVQALQCELMREDSRIRFQGNLFGIVPCDTILKVFLPGEKHAFEVHGISLGPKAVQCIKANTSAILTDPGGGIFLHADRIIQQINLQQNKSVVVIANTGLWYNDLSLFTPIVEPTLNWLYSLTQVSNRKNKVAWHETLRQHWASSDGRGYFEKVAVDNQEDNWKKLYDNFVNVSSVDFLVPHCCQPVANTSHDWRNELIRSRILSNPLFRQNIPILQMAEITKDVPDMHTCNPFYKHDCTHYCYWPLLYQPLWHQLRALVLDDDR